MKYPKSHTTFLLKSAQNRKLAVQHNRLSSTPAVPYSYILSSSLLILLAFHLQFQHQFISLYNSIKLHRFPLLPVSHHSISVILRPCSFGASSLKISNSRLGAARIESANSKQPLHGVKVPNARQFDGLALSQRSSKDSNRCLCLPLKNAQSGTRSEDCSEVANSSESRRRLVPNALEVESLLSKICDTTSIAEFEMKVGGFRLYVMRDLGGEITNIPLPPLPASNVVDPTPEASEVNGSASSPSLAITKASPGVQSLLDKATDEGLTIIQSPRVGYFKRSRTIKGKRAPPSCKEKQIVKEGQVICYVEQLGCELPIESDVAGEVVKILHEDGDAVGYGDALIAILPSFPGIKKLQ